MKKTSRTRVAAGKKHFNSIDVLIVALLLFVLFGLFMSVFSTSKTTTSVVLTLKIDAGDAEQLGYAGITVAEGAAVYDDTGTTYLGILKSAYSPDDRTLIVLLSEDARQSEYFMYGETVGVRAGDLICKCATVFDIEEVAS